MKMKEYMNNMPETIKTKKEIEAYFKDGMKKAVENNNVDKPKKEPNDYQKFMKEQIKVLKKEDPNLTGPQVFSMVASRWRTQKGDNGAKDNIDNVDNVDNVDEEVNQAKDEAKEEVKDEAKEEVKEEVKEVKEEVKEVKEKKKKQK